MRQGRVIPLRQFLETVEHCCRSMSREELMSFVLDTAREAGAWDRPSMLDRLGVPLHRRVDSGTIEGLLASVEELREDIQERVRSIDDGSFWDDADQESWNEYHDDSPPPISDDHKDELEDLFARADRLFLAEHLDAASRLYAALLALIGTAAWPMTDASRPVPADLLGLDWRETRARAARAAYETADPGRRMEAVFDAMVPGTPDGRDIKHLVEGDLPLLADVADARPGSLPGWDEFLSAWRERLGKVDTPRARLLAAEAAFLGGGIAALVKLAREPAARDGVPYLYWIHLLRKQGPWSGLAATCREALSRASLGQARLGVAEILAEAGRAAGEEETVLDGLRESFRADATADRLAALLGKARSLGPEARELGDAADFLGRDRRLRSLYVAALLAAGKIDEAWSVAGSGAKAVGWSFDDTGVAVLYAGVLAALCGRGLEDAPVVRGLLVRYATDRDDPGTVEGDADSLAACIVRGTESIALAQEDAQRYSKWAEGVASRRVEGIVSAKHRRAYGRAAEALGALAECLAIRGEVDHARALIARYRDDMFRRHVAFRAELDAVLEGSPLLEEFTGT